MSRKIIVCDVCGSDEEICAECGLCGECCECDEEDLEDLEDDGSLSQEDEN